MLINNRRIKAFLRDHLYAGALGEDGSRYQTSDAAKLASVVYGMASTGEEIWMDGDLIIEFDLPEQNIN